MSFEAIITIALLCQTPGSNRANNNEEQLKCQQWYVNCAFKSTDALQLDEKIIKCIQKRKLTY